MDHIKCLSTSVKMETPIYAYLTAEVCSVSRFYTTKNKSVVEIHQKIIQVRRSSVCLCKWCIDRWHNIFKKGRTVVGDSVSESGPAII